MSNDLSSVPRLAHAPRGGSPCTGMTRALRHGHLGATSVLASAGAGADIANRDPPYKKKSPPYCCKLGKGAHMCHMGAHAR